MESTPISPDGGDKKEERARIKSLNEIKIRRVFSSIPICWDEVTEAIPCLSETDALDHLTGRKDDFNRRVLYAELFQWHPALKIKVQQRIAANEVLELKREKGQD